MVITSSSQRIQSSKTSWQMSPQTKSGPATDGPNYVRVSAFNSDGLEGMPSNTVTIMYLFHEKGN